MLKNIKLFSISAIVLFLLAFVKIAPTIDGKKLMVGKTYYVHPTLGDDENDGVSKENPFKTFAKIATLQLKPKDSILLAANEIFEEGLSIINQHGTKKNPIVISTYGAKKSKAIIKAADYLNGVYLKNSSNIVVSNLDISAFPGKNHQASTKNEMRCGVLIEGVHQGEFNNIRLENLNIHDVFYEKTNFKRPINEVKSANGTQNYGWGIRVISKTEGSKFNNLTITNCIVTNVSHTGIKLTARVTKENNDINHFTISNNNVSYTGGPGIQMSSVSNGHIYNNIVNFSGSNNDSRKWGRGSGLWTWSSNNILIEKNKFLNANGPGDSAGAHIDFNCNNVVLQYNLSANNAGGFCEILGNNYNCAYRYNVSINDGYRVKNSDGAFQEGKILWLSGYVGEKKKRSGPFNSYIYNNTIFVKKDILAKISIDKNAEGILIANNIFHIESETISVKGDQYNPEKDGDWTAKNIVFTNNLYLSTSSWPKNFILQDQNPFYGNSEFEVDANFDISKMIPKATHLIKNKGIQIEKLKDDKIGLIYNLSVKQDILGNPINNKPDIGAIEIK